MCCILSRTKKLTQAQAIIIAAVIGGVFLLVDALIQRPDPPPTPTPTLTFSPTSLISETPALTVAPSASSTPTDHPSATVSPTQTPTSSTLAASVVVNVQSANLRSGPGLNCSVIRTASYNETFVIVARDQNSDWYLIEIPNHSNVWISSTVVRVINSEGGLPAVRAIPCPPPTAANPNIIITDTPTTHSTQAGPMDRGPWSGTTNTPTSTENVPPPAQNMPADAARYCAEALQGAQYTYDTCSVVPGTYGDTDGNGLVQVGWNEVCAHLYKDAYRYARQDSSGSWACYSN